MALVFALVYLSFGAGDRCQKCSIRRCPEAFLMLFRWDDTTVIASTSTTSITSNKQYFFFLLSAG